jgi:hypothetical protein
LAGFEVIIEANVSFLARAEVSERRMGSDRREILEHVIALDKR